MRELITDLEKRQREYEKKAWETDDRNMVNIENYIRNRAKAITMSKVIQDLKEEENKRHISE